MNDLWERALQDLAGRLSSENFDTFLAPLRPQKWEDSALHLAVPNRFYADWITTHYRDVILDALRTHGAPTDNVVRHRVAIRPRDPARDCLECEGKVVRERDG